MDAAAAPRIRAKLNCQSVDEFITLVTPTMTQDGMLLRWRTAIPVGTDVKLALYLINGERVFTADGYIERVEENGSTAQLLIAFQTVDNMEVLEQILAAREAAGLPRRGIPGEEPAGDGEDAPPTQEAERPQGSERPQPAEQAHGAPAAPSESMPSQPSRNAGPSPVGPDLLRRLAELKRPSTGAVAGPEYVKGILSRFYEMWTGSSAIRAEEVCAPTYTDHMPHPGPQGLEGVQGAVDMFRSAFPDSTMTVKFLIAEGDMVAGHAVFEGTHQGAFLGVPPTGRPVRMNTLDIVRIEYGRVAEIWHLEDVMGALSQLGAVAHPEAADELVKLMNSVRKAAALKAGIELDIFANVQDGADAEVVAQRIGCPVRSTRMLLDGLTEMGLLRRAEGTYYLSAVASMHLLPGSSRFVGGMAKILMNPLHWEGYNHLADAVRADGTMLARHAEKPHHPFWATFAQQSRGLSMMVGTQMVNDLGPFIRSRDKVRVLDVGAGSGIYSYLLANAYPHVEVTVLDWPNVVPEMQRWARELNVDPDRVDFLGGDFMRVDLMGPYDLILVGHVYHHIDRRDCDRLTERLAEALEPGGQLVLHEFVTKDTSPWGALFQVTMLAWTQQGECYSLEDYRAWFAQHGVTMQRVIPNAGLKTVIIIGEKDA